ncbi:MAG: hypothetical protein S4CHLAM102_13940 [Chlamydiia bacterium]|nr:hypothetical protein [Chlamydiia bacterium]
MSDLSHRPGQIKFTTLKSSYLYGIILLTKFDRGGENMSTTSSANNLHVINSANDGLSNSARPIEVISDFNRSIDIEWLISHSNELRGDHCRAISFLKCKIEKIVFEKLVEWTNWNGVEELSMIFCHLEGAEWGSPLASFIRTHPNITLHLAGNHLCDAIFWVGVEMFKHHRDVNLTQTNISGTMLEWALPEIIHSPTQTLALSKSFQSSMTDIPATLRIAQRLHSLSELMLEEVGADDLAAYKIRTMLSHTNILHVDLSNNHIGPIGASHLVHFVSGHPTRTVSIQENPIQTGATALGPLLMERCDYVSLSSCGITADTMAQFANRITSKPSDSYLANKLVLSGNPLGYKGGLAALSVGDHLPNMQILVGEHAQDTLTWEHVEELATHSDDHATSVLR